jgi:hypothetical protein
MVSSQSFAGYENKIQPSSIDDSLYKTVKRSSLHTSSNTFQNQNGNTNNRLSMNIVNNSADFYLKTMLRYVRSGNDKNFAEKVINK